MPSWAELITILGISITINLVFFSLAFFIQRDIFTDITYASTFLLTMLGAMILTKNYSINAFLSLMLIALWSVRLGTFLLIRIIKEKVDHRFDNMRGNFWKFFMFWLLQAITVFIVAMPSYFVAIFRNDSFNLISLIGIIGALIFLVFETVADAQKFIFFKNKKGKFIKSGLWKISRHPNYFGEYMFWIFNFIFSVLALDTHLIWISIIGPLFIMLMLYKVSGLPMLEKSMWKSLKNNPEYLEYIKTTPTLIPLLGKKGIKGAWMNENIGR